ncbi:DNA-3-methyladenine glycosylase [Caulobacter sp. S45]|uniref:DNA-3-methyladenine glycosylase family protein n=1 Tax=Caulobacter sp. S45 TaxID=1641861 RepID=UPI001C204E68|nr:DNA-3-methyladenine glycosylase [Caulobacter sp. S45]
MMTNPNGPASRYAAAERFLREHDADWARLVQQVGPCLHDPKAAREPYEALVRAIAYQQLTAKAGDAMVERLKAMAGTPFPSPSEICALEPEALRACGFSGSKSATIQAIAAGALSGLVPTRAVADTMDDEVLIARLISIKGVGRWTVEMMLMYSLERIDVFPVDDFGVREGYRRLKSLPQQPAPKALKALSAAWSPHRTVAAWYLWRIPRDQGDRAAPRAAAPA